ncbi:hypothetical protein CBR_g81381, partial [Chara braunii]
ILGQSLFGNAKIHRNGYPLPWQGEQGAFGRQWLKCGVYRVADLWDEEKGEWKEDAQLEAVLRHQADRKQRLDQVRKAILETWKQRLSHNWRTKGEWVALNSEELPEALFRIKAQDQEDWYWVEGWEVTQTDEALGQPLKRQEQRDGVIHKDNMRSVVVVRDKRQKKGDSFRPFKIRQHPLQIPWDPSVWEWKATNSQRCATPPHQTTTKVIYRSLNTPTDMADEMKERWRKKGWLQQEDGVSWTQQTWEKACTLLTRLPDQKQAGGLWLNLQLAVPTYQWMAAYSAATDTLCKACGQKEETIPHLWLDCDSQRLFWEWWGTVGDKVPLHPESPKHRAEVLVGQILAGGVSRPVQAYAGDMIGGAFWMAMWAMRGRLLMEGVKGSAKTLQHWFLRKLKAAVTTDMQRKQKGGWPFLREAWGGYVDVLQMEIEPDRWEWSDGLCINKDAGDSPDQGEGDSPQAPPDESEQPENGTYDGQQEEEMSVEVEQMESGTQDRQQAAERPDRGGIQEDVTQDREQGNERPERETAQAVSTEEGSEFQEWTDVGEVDRPC